MDKSKKVLKSILLTLSVVRRQAEKCQGLMTHQPLKKNTVTIKPKVNSKRTFIFFPALLQPQPFPTLISMVLSLRSFLLHFLLIHLFLHQVNSVFLLSLLPSPYFCPLLIVPHSFTSRFK